MESLKEFKEKAVSSIEEGIASASKAIKSGTATAQTEAAKMYETAQEFSNTALAEAKRSEDTLVSYLKAKVKLAGEYPTATAATVTGLAVVTVPGLRRFLIQQTLRRFRSEEGAFKSAETRMKRVVETMEHHDLEIKKLEERLALAQEEYKRGSSKLRATGSQMLTLSKQLQAAESEAKYLVGELRRLPSKQALQLRSEVSNKIAAVKQQRNMVDKHISQLMKQGLV